MLRNRIRAEVVLVFCMPLVLAACSGNEMAGDSPAPASASPPVNYTGVWSSQIEWLSEGITAGVPVVMHNTGWAPLSACLLYTSDAADEHRDVGVGGGGGGG